MGEEIDEKLDSLCCMERIVKLDLLRTNFEKKEYKGDVALITYKLMVIKTWMDIRGFNIEKINNKI